MSDMILRHAVHDLLLAVEKQSEGIESLRVEVKKLRLEQERLTNACQKYPPGGGPY